MERVAVEDVEPIALPDGNVPPRATAGSVGNVRQLTRALGTTDLPINYYELAPGESFTVSVHRHDTHEEVFYVLSDTVTFETETETGDVTLDAGDVCRVPPDTFQLGTNQGDEWATAITLGAPREYQAETEWLVGCEACGERTVHVVEGTEDGSAFVYRCTECDSETYRFSA